MGLIDILTQYDAKKKAAHAAKTVKHGVSAPHSLSFLGLTVSPERELLGSEQRVSEEGCGGLREVVVLECHCSASPLPTGGGRDLHCPP